MEGKAVFRKWRKDDIPFITSSWLRSFRDGAFVRGVPNTIYYYFQQKWISELVSTGRAHFIMVCDREDDKQLLGYVCLEKDVSGALIFHYVYVKQPFRRLGLARKVIEQILEQEKPTAVFYTHKTFALLDYRQECEKQGKPYGLKDWVYNPFLIFERPKVTPA